MGKNLLRFTRTLSVYRQIKESGEAERSRQFGVRAIVLAILFAIISISIPFLMKTSDGGGLAQIIAILGLVIVAAMLFVLLLWMIFYVTLQLKLNRSAIGYVALVFLLAAIAAAVIITLVLNK